MESQIIYDVEEAEKEVKKLCSALEVKHRILIQSIKRLKTEECHTHDSYKIVFETRTYI